MTAPATTDRPTPRTIVDKIWADHVVADDPGAPSVLAIDLHLIHEVTSPQAFTGLRERGLSVRRPGQTVATADHSIPTTPRDLPMLDMQAAAQIRQLEQNCAEFGIPLHGIGSPSQGIVHVIGPQLGTDPAGDDDRLRRLAHVDARGVRGARVRDRDERGRDGPRDPDACSSAARRRTRSASTAGSRRASAAKDIILALIARIGVGGGTGHVFEYRGEAIRALTMEQRMTICNMSIEGGARAGLIAPDDTTFEYVARPAARAAGRRLGRGRRALADAADRRRRDLRPVGHDRRRRARADGHLRHEPRHGHPDHVARPVARPTRRIRPRGARSSTRSSTWICSPASRSSARRSTSCSSARARTAGSATCGSRPRSLKDRQVADGVRLMVVPGSRRGEARGRARGPRTRSSGPPAPSGARRAARCASR